MARHIKPDKEVQALLDESVHHEQIWHLNFMPNLGIGHLTITQASELTALDMWFSGDEATASVPEPPEFDGSKSDPRLREALSSHILALEEKLVSAVDSGRIEASFVRRTMDEKIIPEKTYIEDEALCGWLLERGYDYGDVIAEWKESEDDLRHHVQEEIVFQRVVRQAGRRDLMEIGFHAHSARWGMLDDESDSLKLVEAMKGLVIEIDALKAERKRQTNDHRVDRPPSTRSKRTLLTVIGALCHRAGIQPTARGAAQRIREMVEEIGVSIDDGTISKVLQEIPDAVESRMK